MDENVKNVPVEGTVAEAPTEEKELIQTYGFDLKIIIADARANGNGEFADEVEKQIANLQACYDIIAQRHTSAGGEDVWKIDASELKARLK